mmetsp:Transcript_94311/g.236776  ORF Transcript_94311/g.236776 Transcript_94311/m.236776 type:complete len:490 (-) Transcript_94311:21-1490(-)
MGLCALCVSAPVGRERSIDLIRKNRLKPLLFDLESNFRQYAGSDQQLDADELADLWKQSTKRQSGSLRAEEATLIEEASRELLMQMDADADGKVSYHEFVSFSLGGMESRGALRSLRAKMADRVRSDPSKLRSLVETFQAWDKNGDGFVTIDELDQYVAELAQHAEPPPSGLWCCSCGGNAAARDATAETAAAQAERLKCELLSIADVDNDGKLDLWEVMAWTLGRRKTPVELLLYDISKGAAKWLGPLLLADFNVEAFHSSVLVFGSEYWYGGDVFRSEPPCDKQFGPPLAKSKVLQLEPSEVRPDLKVVRMGYTLVTHQEFVKFLDTKVLARYSDVSKYDLITHSCNHFTDELLHFLLGRGVPDHVLKLQRMAETSAPSALRTMRPFLNHYLGGFSGQGGGGDQLLEDTKVKEGPRHVDPSELLGEGAVVVLDGGAAGIDDEGSTVVATILKEKAGVCEIKYFDPAEQKLSVMSGVPESAILKRVAK